MQNDKDTRQTWAREPARRGRAPALDAFGVCDAANMEGPLCGVDFAAVVNVAAPEGAARAILAGFRPAGAGMNLAFVEQAQTAGFETCLGSAHNEYEARRDTAIEVVAAVAELAVSPHISEIVLVCPRDHVELIARRVRAAGKRLLLADHPRSGFGRYARLVDELIELPAACWPLTLGRAA